MKRIFKWLVPQFFRDFDDHLLKNYPLLWRTGIHLVLFYGSLSGILLFTAGFFYPVHKDGTKWVVDPIKPIELAYDKLYIYPLVLVLMFIVFWASRQFRLGFPFYQLRVTLFTLLIYISGLWFLIGITASAFRLGTIVHVAKFWVNDEQLNTFKKSKIFPYGFVLLKQDSILNIPGDTIAFFQKREKEFESNWIEEYLILNERYVTDSELGAMYLSPKLYPDQSYRADRPWKRSISNPAELLEISNMSRLSFISFLSYRLFRLHLLNYTDPQLNKSDLSFLSTDSNLLYFSIFSRITNDKLFDKIEKQTLPFGIKNYQNIVSKKPLIIIPSLPNKLEEMIRSIDHARQYLKEGIFWRHFLLVGFYGLFFGVLLFLIPFLSLDEFFKVSMMMFLTWVVFRFFILSEHSWIPLNSKKLNILAYLLFPGLGFLNLARMVLIKKQTSFFNKNTNMVFLGVLITLFGALNYGKNMVMMEFGSPVDGAFFGAQVMGLLATCLVPYDRVMPRKV